MTGSFRLLHLPDFWSNCCCGATGVFAISTGLYWQKHSNILSWALRAGSHKVNTLIKKNICSQTWLFVASCLIQTLVYWLLKSTGTINNRILFVCFIKYFEKLYALQGSMLSLKHSMRWWFLQMILSWWKSWTRLLRKVN